MIRKVIKVGNSDGVTIPKQWLVTNKIKEGDEVEIYVGKPGSSVSQLELLKQLEQFNKKYGQALNKLTK